MSDNIVIVASKRTAIGNFLGCFKDTSAVQLGSAVLRGTLDQCQLDPALLDSVIMGCVLPAGLGQAPARQAAIAANIPDHVGAVTINKVCGSGMQAVIFGHDSIKAGSIQAAAVGAMENMTNAPYLLTKARQGYRFGTQPLLDHMFLDGLDDAYEHQSMGTYAEATAKKYGFTRAQQDEFALRSLTLAQTNQANGVFAEEIVPVHIQQKKSTITIDLDEGPPALNPEKIPLLKPAFAADGTVTAANSSSISDGAATMIVTSESFAKQHGLTPIAKIIAHGTHSQAPAWFTTAPVGAIESVLKKANWQIDDVDLFEINEAFAVVVMAAMHDLKLPEEKINVLGGACALGHPLATSGTRIIVTLLNALKQRQLKRGVAALCLGGGEATAIAIELCL